MSNKISKRLDRQIYNFNNFLCARAGSVNTVVKSMTVYPLLSVMKYREKRTDITFIFFLQVISCYLGKISSLKPNKAGYIIRKKIYKEGRGQWTVNFHGGNLKFFNYVIFLCLFKLAVSKLFHPKLSYPFTKIPNKSINNEEGLATHLRLCVRICLCIW